MQSNIIQILQNRGINTPELSISSVYGDLTFERAACAVERCGIAFSTEIVELPGTCLVFDAFSTRFHFQLRWQGLIRVAETWDHPDVGFAAELEGDLPPHVKEWLRQEWPNEEYPGTFRLLPRTALIFASELHRTRFAEAVAAR